MSARPEALLVSTYVTYNVALVEPVAISTLSTLSLIKVVASVNTIPINSSPTPVPNARIVAFDAVVNLIKLTLLLTVILPPMAGVPFL